MYVKSIYTEQIYKVDTMPEFGGWVVVTEEEYKAWQCQAFDKKRDDV